MTIAEKLPKQAGLEINSDIISSPLCRLWSHWSSWAVIRLWLERHPLKVFSEQISKEDAVRLKQSDAGLQLELLICQTVTGVWQKSFGAQDQAAKSSINNIAINRPLPLKVGDTGGHSNKGKHLPLGFNL